MTFLRQLSVSQLHAVKGITFSGLLESNLLQNLSYSAFEKLSRKLLPLPFLFLL